MTRVWADCQRGVPFREAVTEHAAFALQMPQQCCSASSGGNGAFLGNSTLCVTS